MLAGQENILPSQAWRGQVWDGRLPMAWPRLAWAAAIRAPQPGRRAHRSVDVLSGLESMMRIPRIRVGAAIIATCMIISSCTLDDGAQSSASHHAWIIRPRLETGLEIHAHISPDTVRLGGGSPINLFYSITNGPEEATVFPDAIELKVLGPDGAVVSPRSESSPPLTMDRPAQVTLAGGATLMQVQDLGCIVEMRASDAPRARKTCLARYRFVDPGTHTIIINYNGLDDYANLDSLVAAAEKGEVRFPVQPKEVGIRMSDTARLVIQR
jgi:hypothetical protein